MPFTLVIRAALALALALSPAFLASPVSAQEDVAAAAQAFEAGQSAQLRGDHGAAAGFFELADRLAPSPAALRSAIRNHSVAGSRARAATLAADALRRYPADASVRGVADEALATAGELGAFDIACDAPCLATLDGAALETEARSSRSVFVEPGVHRIEASFDGGPAVQEQAEVAAGGRVAVAIESPPVAVSPEPAAPVPPVSVAAAPEAGPEAGQDPRQEPGREPMSTEVSDDSGGLIPMWVAYAGLGATAVVGAVTLWSGVDTLSARDEYVADPTEVGYEDGVSRQARTNALIGVTVGLGVATAALFVLASIGGGEERPVTASVGAGPRGATVHLSGSF